MNSGHKNYSSQKYGSRVHSQNLGSANWNHRVHRGGEGWLIVIIVLMILIVWRIMWPESLSALLNMVLP